MCCFVAITVTFDETTYSVDEDDGPAQPVLVLSNPSSTAISVQVRDTSRSATGKCIVPLSLHVNCYINILGGGVDYGSGPYTVTFPAGTTRVPFDVPINNDNLFERNEIFDLTIIRTTLPTGVSRGSPNNARVTIVDNDRKLC